jgi:hypothetical protein
MAERLIKETPNDSFGIVFIIRLNFKIPLLEIFKSRINYCWNMTIITHYPPIETAYSCGNGLGK